MAELNEPKKETVRITLPPRPPRKTAGPGSDRSDTVRIKLPARPPSNGASPQTASDISKPIEQTQLAIEAAPPAASPVSHSPPPAEPFRPPPIVPPPPPSDVSNSAPAFKSPPPMPPPVAPKPPSVEVAPPPRTVAPPSPVAPSTPPLPPAQSSQVPVKIPPVTSPASAEPKKETARISLIPQPPSRLSSTIKMAKTQPLIPAPPSATQPLPVTIAPTAQSSWMDVIPWAYGWAFLALSAILFIVNLWIYFS